jgi:hypothetical protein
VQRQPPCWGCFSSIRLDQVGGPVWCHCCVCKHLSAVEGPS